MTTEVERVTGQLAASVRNLDNRLREVSKHEHSKWYTEVSPAGDGITDQTLGLQTAMSLAAAGGGTVVIGPGTLLASGVVLYSNVHLRGVGINATTIKLPDGVNQDVIISDDFANLVGTNGSGGVHSWSLSGLTVDGNKANNLTSGWGIRVYGYGYVLRDIVVRNCRSGGIYSEWSGTVADAPGPDSMEAHLSGFVVHENAGVGIHWNGPHDSTWSHGHVYQNGTGTGTVVGVLVGANGNGLQAVLCHVWGVNHTYPWRLEGNAFLVNCVGEGGSEAQVLIAASDCQVVGGDYFGYEANPSYGIQIGTGGTAVGGTDVHTKVLNCLSGAVRFENDSGAGSRVVVAAYQSSGAVYSGTPNAGTLRIIQAAGGATGGHTYVPHNLDVQGQVFIRNTGLTDALAVQDSGGASLLVVDQVNDWVQLANGGVLRGFSDQLSTLRWQIDSSTGYADFSSGSIRIRHIGGNTPTGGNSGDLLVGDGKIWVNDGGTWKSVAVA